MALHRRNIGVKKGVTFNIVALCLFCINVEERNSILGVIPFYIDVTVWCLFFTTVSLITMCVLVELTTVSLITTCVL